MKKDFKHLHVLITRPLNQAHQLANQIMNRGGRTTLFPTILIQPTLQEDKWIRTLTIIKQAVDYFIFVSANAVTPVAPYLKDTKIPIFAVGPGTESVIIQEGLTVKNRPVSLFSSEGILQLPELQSIFNKKIAIFSGEQSKSLLSETLQQRGAQVCVLEVYRRVCPKVDITAHLENWKKVNVVISTSQTSLKNLSIILGKTYYDFFQKTPLIVITPLMRKTALYLKIGDPVFIARDATTESITKTLEFLT